MINDLFITKYSQGGYGSVFKVKNLTDDGYYAVKRILLPDK